MDLISVLVAMSMMLLSVIIVKMLDNTPIKILVSTNTENYYNDDDSDSSEPSDFDGPSQAKTDGSVDSEEPEDLSDPVF